MGTGSNFDYSDLGIRILYALVSLSLRLGRVLKSLTGLLGKMELQSELLDIIIMFQFLLIIFQILGLLGLKLVTISGVSVINLWKTSSIGISS